MRTSGDVVRVAGPVRPKRLRLAALGALAMVLAFLYAGSIRAEETYANGPCTDVEVIGLRGSSEDSLGSEHRMGALLGPVTDTIATKLSGAVTFSAYGVPYPAADAITGVLTGSYLDSKEEGSDMLHDYLLERAIECPAARFVVMGYSQGAHAAGDQLAREGTFLTDRVAAFVMFGDPRFNPEATYTWGDFDHRDHGIAGARSLSDFSGWSNRVFSFCHRNDLVCQGFGWGHTTSTHKAQTYVDDYANLVAGLVRRKLGLTDLPRVPLDLAFVIDSTGSMWSSIDEVRESVSSIVDELENQAGDYRVGLVDYKDTDQGDVYAAQLGLDLSTDVSAFDSALEAITAYGGGDYPEAVFSGLMKAFGEMSWRSASRKAVILMGDAPAKDPEPITGYTMADVLAASRSLAGSAGLSATTSSTRAAATGSAGAASIYPVVVEFGGLETFEPLARETGGSLFFASGSSTVADEVLDAVGAAAGSVEVVLSGTPPVRPGQLVSFTAGANYDSGEIVGYEWDFDGDGVADETTSGRQASHVYPDPFEGFAEVTAVAADGASGTASTPVTVSEFAPVPAGPPHDLVASNPASNLLRVTWQPPSDLGGGALAGYEVVVEEVGTGDLVDARGVGSSSNVFSLGALPDGTYSVTVRAITDAGPGAPAKGQSAVGLVSPPSSTVAPAAVPPHSTNPAPAQRRLKCKKGFRPKKANGKRRCVKRKKHHPQRKKSRHTHS